MGYYTDFEIKVITPETIDNDEFQEKLEEISDYSFEHFEGILSTNAKWYYWQENLEEVSKKFPSYLIEVSGVGEEFGDIWKAYFKNGKYTIIRAQIVFEEFTEDMLE